MNSKDCRLWLGWFHCLDDVVRNHSNNTNRKKKLQLDLKLIDKTRNSTLEIFLSNA